MAATAQHGCCGNGTGLCCALSSLRKDAFLFLSHAPPPNMHDLFFLPSHSSWLSVCCCNHKGHKTMLDKRERGKSTRTYEISIPGLSRQKSFKQGSVHDSKEMKIYEGHSFGCCQLNTCMKRWPPSAPSAWSPHDLHITLTQNFPEIHHYCYPGLTGEKYAGRSFVFGPFDSPLYPFGAGPLGIATYVTQTG